jgi:hypothetical protein
MNIGSMNTFFTCMAVAGLNFQSCKSSLGDSREESALRMKGKDVGTSKGVPSEMPLERRLAALNSPYAGAAFTKLSVPTGPADSSITANSNVLLEAKLGTLMGNRTEEIKYEASGVVLDALGRLVVVNDNQSESIMAIPLIRQNWAFGAGFLLGAQILDEQSHAGFEGITIAMDTNSNESYYYLLQEIKWSDAFARKPSNRVLEVDLNRGGISRCPADACKIIEHAADRFATSLEQDRKFVSENKGNEGLSSVSLLGQTLMLTLCEGNLCMSKDKDLTEEGYGGILTFYRLGRKGKSWHPAGSLNLGPAVPFNDFSDLSIAWGQEQIHGAESTIEGSLLITSQMDSAIFAGTLTLNAALNHDDKDKIEVTGSISNGHFYELGSASGYCNVEGITWVDLDRHIVAVASDAAKKDEANTVCNDKDQSLHIVKLQ